MRAGGIVLAGGRSARLGHDKLAEVFGGRTLVERVVECVASLVDEVLIVTAAGRTMTGFEEMSSVRVVTDLFPGKGPLVGLYTGLKESRSELNLVVAADMPFLSAGLLRYMLDLADGYDVVVPRVGDTVEPLHAVYAASCLPHIEAMLAGDDRSVFRLIPRLTARYLDEGEVAAIDPERRSFFNINTEDDLRRARELAGRGC